MAQIMAQKDLILTFKKETLLNVGVLSKVHPLPSELARQLFMENALEKPTQNLFNNLSYYLISLIDPQLYSRMPWPIYDSTTERTYRSKLSSFINDYSTKGLLSPVMSSYLVNPGNYKVVMLINQMSQLAVQRLLRSTIKSDHQKKRYEKVTHKYSSNQPDFIEDTEKEIMGIMSKLSNHLQKRKVVENVAEILRNKINHMDETLTSTKAQICINELVDTYVSTHKLDNETKNDLLKVKDVYAKPTFFSLWLEKVDQEIEEMESQWDTKVAPFQSICNEAHLNTKSLIARHTGEADRASYSIEYNPKTDQICTKELQNHVNSQQKYILINLEKDSKLNFPHLIRAFLISICFILKNAEIEDDIYKFNEYLDSGRKKYSEIVSAMKNLIQRVMTAEKRLEPTSEQFDLPVTTKLIVIPPLPDFSDLKMNKDVYHQMFIDTFTPLILSKQFNLSRRVTKFAKPQAVKALLNVPFNQRPQEDFMRCVNSCRTTYDCHDATQNVFDMSIISHVSSKGNETVAESSTGFTKQQILRLLSTKKSSMSKKWKYQSERSEVRVKRGGLFNESTSSYNSRGLTRSYSSPDLSDSKESRPFTRVRGRKLSITQADISAVLEVSGIMALDKDSTYETPPGSVHLNSTRKVYDVNSFPVITLTTTDENFHEKLKDFHNNLEKDLNMDEVPSQTIIKEIIEKKSKTETPKNKAQLNKKTNSLENIINRFKKVRANVLPVKDGGQTDFKTIVEEKDISKSMNTNNPTANRYLLPDLLSPSYNAKFNNPTDYLDNFWMSMDNKDKRKPRESLGTALGIDQTFMDQLDLVD